MTEPGTRAFEWRIRLDLVTRDRIAERVAARRARVHLLVGPDGIGKSTLLVAIGDRLAAEGHPVIRVTGHAALSGIPLGALAPILAADAAATPAERLQRLFDTVAPARANHVLLVDDAHLLDPESGAAITQLVRSYGIRAVLAAPSAQALGDEVARLAEDGIVETTRLPRLDAASAAMAIEAAIGGRVDPDDLRSLVRRAGGNPLHLREIVAAIVRDETAVPAPHGLRIRASPLPARLRRTIRERYARLDAASRHYAELLAIAGDLPAPEEPAEVEAVDALEAAGLVERADGGGQRLAEPLHGEILIGAIATRDRDALAVEAGTRLMTAGDPSRRRRAVTILAGTSAPPSIADLEWASAEAHAREDHAAAVELADAAIRLAPARGETVTPRALAVRADALSIDGRIEEAEAAFAAVLDATHDDDVLAFAASRLGFHRALRRMDPEDGARVAETFRARLRDRAAIAFLDANVAKLRFMSGGSTADPDRDAADDGLQELNVQLMRIARAAFTGELAEARDALERGRPVAVLHADAMPHAGAAFDFGAFLLLVDEARGDEALRHVREVRERRDDESKGMWAYATALLALLRGDAETAYEAATDAAELLAWRDFIAAQGPAKGLRATAAARTGRHAVAREILGTIDEANRRTNIATGLQAAEAEAWLLSAAGAVDEAAAVIAAAVRRGLDGRHTTFSALTAHTAVRLGRPETVLPMLREALAAAPEVRLIRLAVEHAEALAARDPAALLAAATALETAGFDGPAADAARQAVEIAQAQGAVSLARRARLIAARLGAARPGTDGDATTVLTPRELAVATAAAERRRNREIAEQLQLSVRTVENHLASAYRKLGVASRDELRGVLG